MSHMRERVVLLLFPPLLALSFRAEPTGGVRAQGKGGGGGRDSSRQNKRRVMWLAGVLVLVREKERQRETDRAGSCAVTAARGTHVAMSHIIPSHPGRIARTVTDSDSLLPFIDAINTARSSS